MCQEKKKFMSTFDDYVLKGSELVLNNWYKFSYITNNIFAKYYGIFPYGRHKFYLFAVKKELNEINYTLYYPLDTRENKQFKIVTAQNSEVLPDIDTSNMRESLMKLYQNCEKDLKKLKDYIIRSKKLTNFSSFDFDKINMAKELLDNKIKEIDEKSKLEEESKLDKTKIINAQEPILHEKQNTLPVMETTQNSSTTKKKSPNEIKINEMNINNLNERKKEFINEFNKSHMRRIYNLIYIFFDILRSNSNKRHYDTLNMDDINEIEESLFKTKEKKKQLFNEFYEKAKQKHKNTKKK